MPAVRTEDRAVRTPPRLLVADDNPLNVDILRTRLTAQGYEVLTAGDGEAALAVARAEQPDLLLLDIMMPGLDGLEVCRRLKADPTLPFMPVILVTAKADSRDIVAGLDAGADEYLPKPVDQAALVARVKSMLRSRVRAQVEQLERLGRLKRFFSPHLADAIVQGGAEDPLKTHRREVTVVFADLRGFTAFAEGAEPEEVMAVLREYHTEMGRLILAHEGTLERFTGDGLMVFFNDPIPVPDAAERAVRMAVAMRDRVAELAARWRREGYELDLGLGIARGYATLGAIGFEGRWDYAALGTVTNLAARLCGEARGGQILVASRVLSALDSLVDADSLGEVTFKGFLRPVPVFNIRKLRA